MILTGYTGQFPQVRRRCPETVEKQDAFGAKQDKESAGILRKSKENPSCGDFMKVGSEPANRRALGLQTVRRCSKIGATLAFGAERPRSRMAEPLIESEIANRIEHHGSGQTN